MLYNRLLKIKFKTLNYYVIALLFMVYICLVNFSVKSIILSHFVLRMKCDVFFSHSLSLASHTKQPCFRQRKPNVEAHRSYEDISVLHFLSDSGGIVC